MTLCQATICLRFSLLYIIYICCLIRNTFLKLKLIKSVYSILSEDKMTNLFSDDSMNEKMINFNKTIGTIYWDADSKHMQPSGEPFSSLPVYCHWVGALTESSKVHSTILSRQLVQHGGDHGKISKFMSMSLLSHLFYCKMNSLIRSNTVWNSMTVHKAFFKPKAGSFDRNVPFRGDMFTSRVNVYFSKNQVFLFPW